ncbi:conserved protein of unknown function(Domain of unknown function DUF4159,670-874) [Magnetospirillum sp. XM-1]|uniref:DUF4159 domain-containing protein n=1 Tax=Magnetospirillum sp. XM-1 TaxID=1663591 RepID=UPI00073DFF96|nr:DUF4159 domain-containing protein [Magnetospirillum sp. XM-1]CUW38560.1 conserved protein of unknown function(Domain of unknown function DUF4159,670-874) [Magnetospirillum sp. XM-1]
MMVIGGLTFAAPWALALLAGLPLLWRLLRVTPPRPRKVSFPALSLLLGLDTARRQAEATPFWLLALRLALAAALILAAAGPSLAPHSPIRGDGPLLLLVDDGWAAARDWDRRREHLDQVLAAAERSGRPVVTLATAPPADGGPVALGRLMPAADSRALAAGLEPRPWPTDRAGALKALDSLPFDRAGQVVWLNDGLADPADGALSRRLQGLGGGLEIVTGRSGRLLLPGTQAERLAPVIRRLPSDEAEPVDILALDAKGTVLARGEGRFEAGRATTDIPLDLPTQLRNRLTRLEIEGERSAGATLLLDEGSRRRSAGLAGGDPASAPLLDRLYYVERALAPHAELKRGEVAELAADPALDVIVLADVPLPPGPNAARLAARVEQGAVLLRFAGPLLVQSATDDPLLPVRLLSGGRTLGGVLSWTTPMRLAPFPEASPFHGLVIPDDVEIRSQVLAEPGLELSSRTWASLADGTPLVTAHRRGKGLVVLIHTSANAEWGNLALSGLFVDMLRRMTALSQRGSGATVQAGKLAPAEVLDGLGRAHPAAGINQPLDQGALAATLPQPRHPPGLYGPAEGRVAFNLGPALAPPERFVPPPGATGTRLGESRPGLDFRPPLALAALLLALIDMAATFTLRGLLWRAALVAVALGGPSETRAASFALEAGLATRLACIATKDSALDRLCLAGLRGLSARLAERSTAEMAEPMLVDPDRDPVVFFPLLYWRITPGQQPPSEQAAEKLNAYMAKGGVILFDTGDEGNAGAGPDAAELERLRRLVAGLALPPLVPMGPDHVLTRSFYLLKGVPGRWDGATLWVSQGAEAGNDGVSPVVLGGNDWMAAWAVDERGRPTHAVVPGGERQREYAYRFGINLVMYALTGNYKADQVHLPAIMDRLKR